MVSLSVFYAKSSLAQATHFLCALFPIELKWLSCIPSSVLHHPFLTLTHRYGLSLHVCCTQRCRFRLHEGNACHFYLSLVVQVMLPTMGVSWRMKAAVLTLKQLERVYLNWLLTYHSFPPGFKEDTAHCEHIFAEVLWVTLYFSLCLDYLFIIICCPIGLRTVASNHGYVSLSMCCSAGLQLWCCRKRSNSYGAASSPTSAQSWTP